LLTTEHLGNSQEPDITVLCGNSVVPNCLLTRLSVNAAFTVREWWKRSNSRRAEVIQTLEGCSKKPPHKYISQKNRQREARRLGGRHQVKEEGVEGAGVQ